MAEAKNETKPNEVISQENNTPVNAPITPNSSLKHIEELSGQKISTCFQCQKCTNGCPMTSAMDIPPHKLIHGLHLGLVDEAINSDTIWVCSSCETCTTRCPNDIDILHVMDALRHLSTRKGVKASQKQAPMFHRTFLNNVRRLGRMHEPSFAVDYALRSSGIQGLLKQVGLGMSMLRRGKMKIVPARFRAGRELGNIFHAVQRKKKS